ncbi:hypothetical protein B484DRAFT_396167, partial [Ochromonadaceae sp. CCMP2298]
GSVSRTHALDLPTSSSSQKRVSKRSDTDNNCPNNSTGAAGSGVSGHHINSSNSSSTGTVRTSLVKNLRTKSASSVAGQRSREAPPTTSTTTAASYASGVLDESQDRDRDSRDRDSREQKLSPETTAKPLSHNSTAGAKAGRAWGAGAGSEGASGDTGGVSWSGSGSGGGGGVSGGGSRSPGGGRSASKDKVSLLSGAKAMSINRDSPISINSRPELDPVYIDIPDGDGLEFSFDDLALAPFLQQKALLTQQQQSQQGEEEEGRKVLTRPSSRKLYLGADKASNPKTAPRSAGALFSPKRSADVGIPSNDDEPTLKRMASFTIGEDQGYTNWNEGGALPDLRPPSRQSSAFPQHLEKGSEGSKGEAAGVGQGGDSAPKNTLSAIHWDDDDLLGSRDYSSIQDETVAPTPVYPPLEVDTMESGGADVGTSAGMGMGAGTGIGIGIGAGAGAGTLSPSRDLIAIPATRSPLPDEDSVAGGSIRTGYSGKRPPSRQKLAAQHLFEGMPRGADRDRAERGDNWGDRAERVDRGDSHRADWGDAEPRFPQHNPRDDGFTVLDTGPTAPFAILYNREPSEVDFDMGEDCEDYEEGDPTPYSHTHTESGESHGALSVHERLMGRKPHTNGNGGGNGGNGNGGSGGLWSDSSEPSDVLLSPFSRPGSSTGLRPVTGSSGVRAVKPRKYGLVPAPPAASPARLKSANDGVKGKVTAPLTSRANPGSSPRILGAHAGPHGQFAVSNRSSPMMMAPHAGRAWAERTSPTLGALKATSGSPANPGMLQLRSKSNSPPQYGDEENDDMTILTEDSGRPGIESAMSMHSLALDSSLGEDFLSLFAPGP